MVYINHGTYSTAGDIPFCPIHQILHMQHISLDQLWKLFMASVFMPPTEEGTPKLSWTTTILLIFQVDSQHEWITDVYVRLVAHQFESHLYAPEQISDFIKDIDVDLKAVQAAFKAGGDPSKKHAFFLFVCNFGGAMSVPMDLPYCLVYPTSYVKGIMPDHFDTLNNPAGTQMCHCMCCATLQFMNTNPLQYKQYSGSCLIMPHGAQYHEWLFPVILEPQNHCEPLVDSAGKPYPI